MRKTILVLATTAMMVFGLANLGFAGPKEALEKAASMVLFDMRGGNDADALTFAHNLSRWFGEDHWNVHDFGEIILEVVETAEDYDALCETRLVKALRERLPKELRPAATTWAVKCAHDFHNSFLEGFEVTSGRKMTMREALDALKRLPN